jgi:putative hemolysin
MTGMDSSIWIELVVILVLVLANGFFALSEFSVIASRKTRLREKKELGKMGAAAAERLHASPERFLATIQVGITLVGAMLGVFSGAKIVDKLELLFSQAPIELVSRWSNAISIGLVVVSITVLSVVVGELVPKYIALSHPERYARYVSHPITVFLRISAFFSRLLALLASGIVRGIGITRDPGTEYVSEDEINLMILEGKESGVFDETEQEFIRSVFEFSDSTVRRAMRPRGDVIAFDKTADPGDIVKTVIEEGFSRYPIYDESIDKILGVIYAKDLIGVDTSAPAFRLERLVRKPLFVPDSMPLPRLLREFQKGKNHMAIVLDEFGGTFGIITLEDVLEELVGEIRDEYDEEPAPLVKHSDTIAYANGNVWPGDVNELIHSHLPEEKAETLAGLFIDTIGRFPEKNESVHIADTDRAGR